MNWAIVILSVSVVVLFSLNILAFMFIMSINKGQMNVLRLLQESEDLFDDKISTEHDLMISGMVKSFECAKELNLIITALLPTIHSKVAKDNEALYDKISKYLDIYNGLHDTANTSDK